MALGKMLNLGGIDNRPPKANQSLGRFRVARNVMPTTDNRLIPRYGISAIASQPADVKCIHHMSQYDDSMLNFVSEGTSGAEEYAIYKDTTKLPQITQLGASVFQTISNDYTQVVSSYRRNNTTYFQVPGPSGNLFKYDGVQVGFAGCAQPYISCSTIDTTSTKFIKAIQHTIDFDNNEIWSESVDFQVPNANLTTTIRVDKGGTNLIGNGANAPSYALSESRNDAYFVGTATYNSGTSDYSITTTATNITTSLFVGAYIIVSYFERATGTTGLPESSLAVALRVKSVSPLVLDGIDAKYMTLQREWKTADALTASLAAVISKGSNVFISLWRSSSANGIFYYCGFTPSFAASTTSFTYIFDTDPVTSAESGSSNVVISLAPILNDIYDVNSRKLSPNAPYNFGGDYAFYNMTVYQDLMLLANDDIIFFSDIFLAGAFEQLNTATFIKVGGKEYGRITSICGAQDYLIVCRERKNYYVVGNITTGNYRVQDITETSIGAWNNVSTMLVKDSVVMVTALGIFRVVSGGRCEKLSEYCPKNFSLLADVAVNEDVSFKLGQDGTYTSNIAPDSEDNGLALAYDAFREFLLIVQKGSVSGNPALLLHTKTGEIYEWDGFFDNPTSAFYVSSVAFKSGSVYIGQLDTTSANESEIYLENRAGSGITSYATHHPVKLYTSWLTSGEPSLEKQLLQLKIFGLLNTSASQSYPGLEVAHYKDWDITTKITNSNYVPPYTLGATQFSHKKRLNSDKVLAASVGFEVSTATTPFQIEGIEVEFMPIQEGIKK